MMFTTGVVSAGTVVLGVVWGIAYLKKNKNSRFELSDDMEKRKKDTSKNNEVDYFMHEEKDVEDYKNLLAQGFVHKLRKE